MSTTPGAPAHAVPAPLALCDDIHDSILSIVPDGTRRLDLSAQFDGAWTTDPIRSQCLNFEGAKLLERPSFEADLRKVVCPALEPCYRALLDAFGATDVQLDLRIQLRTHNPAPATMAAPPGGLSRIARLANTNQDGRLTLVRLNASSDGTWAEAWRPNRCLATSGQISPTLRALLTELENAGNVLHATWCRHAHGIGRIIVNWRNPAPASAHELAAYAARGHARDL